MNQITEKPYIRRTSEQALEALTCLLGEKVLTSAVVRDHHGHDESFHASCSPDAVIRPHSTQEVADIVRICDQYSMPVIPYGTGTALEGGVVALHGGICIDMSEMNNIIKLNHGDMDVVVQPGVTRRQLAAHLKDTGLFFPIDPGADASLGGMASTRASGTNAVRYGTMKENVINLEAVMADGSIIRTGGRSKKSAAGYDLTRLMVGSEGTLGVITELTVKLYPVPEAMSSATCTFDNLEDAVNSVIQIIQCGIPVARVELIDAKTIEAINVYSKMDYSVAPTLFFEFHGSESYVQEQAELAQEITADNNGGAFTWTRNTEERNKMWRARHDVAYASKLLHPKGKIWSTDVCVPISNLAECLLETQQDIDQTGILAPMVGHVGDGNFHLLLLVDHDNPAEVQKATDLHERMVKRALSLDGTCTGEHGIGFGKIDFLKKEHGTAIQPMLAIKKALDPKGIMNPGKIFEWASPA